MEQSNFDSAPEIEKIARDLLKESKTLGKFPTRVDQLIEYAELKIAQEIDLNGKKQNFFSRTFEGIGKVSKKVLGLLDIRHKTIYLDLTQNVNRQRFIKIHETGHKVFPWQEAVFRWDDKKTIDPSIKKLFEKEANFFASAVLFQLERFDEAAAKLPLSIKSAMVLGEKFGASKQAAIRRYVCHSKKRCAVLVLERPTFEKGLNVRVRNYFESPSFAKEFGSLTWPEVCGTDFSFVKDIIRKRKLHEDGQLNLMAHNAEFQEFTYHYFDNTYNIFIFLMPSGEKIRSRTKILLNTT